MSDPDLNPYAPPQSDPLLPPEVDPHAELATRGSRLGAAILDTVFLLVPFLGLMSFAGSFDSVVEDDGPIWGVTLEEVMWSAVGVVIFAVINWAFLQNGQTLGKKIVGIKVVHRDGSPISAGRYLGVRYLPIVAVSQIPGVGQLISLVDALMIFRKDHNTLHDDIAGTKVIKLVP